MMSEPIGWEHHRAFLAVLHEGSLSGAARALELAQPTVRRRIEELEAGLGAALFTRTPAGLSPTETATALREHAEAMALAAEAMTRTASATADEVAGVVRITASEVIAVEVLPAILAPLRVTHPRLVLVLSPSNRNEDVLRREADIAVRMVPPVQEALVARHVGAARLLLHAHCDYLARTGVPTSLEEVAARGVIGPETDNTVLRAMRAQGFAIGREQFIFRTDSDLAQIATIRAGLGIGMCQAPLARRDPALVPLLAEVFAFDLETWVVTHEDLRGVARIRAVFDRLVEGLSDYLAPRAQPTAAASIAVAAPRNG